MGLLPARMQIADEGMTLGAKVERKAMPSVAEKQKYAHSAFEMNDHQPDGTIKPTMLVSFAQMVEDLQAGLDAMAEHCARNHQQENALFIGLCAELDKRAGIQPVAELESQIWRGMVAAAAMNPPKPLYNPIDFTFDLGHFTSV